MPGAVAATDRRWVPVPGRRGPHGPCRGATGTRRTEERVHHLVSAVPGASGTVRWCHVTGEQAGPGQVVGDGL